jgi:hypothetical protein
VVGKVGHPAIGVARSLPQDAQDIISQIRQRLEALEHAVALASTVNASVAALQNQITKVIQTTTTTVPGTVTYSTTGLISAYTAVYTVATNVVGISDPTIQAQAFGCIGVTTSLGSAGGTVSVATAGSVIQVTGATFTSFLPVFAGPSGVLTQAPPAPSAASAIIQVGVALSSTLLLVAPAPTLLNAVSINPLVDDFLPIARNPGVTWELNGVTIGVRRQVDFLSSSGVPIDMYDDPSNNRVVINIGQTGIIFAANPLEDAWPWDYDEPEEDLTWIGIDDTAQGNNTVARPGLVEDAWNWDYEEPPEELWFIERDDSVQRNRNSAYIEDAWNWEEEPEDDNWWHGFDGAHEQNASIPAQALQGSLDAPWWEDEPEEDLWWHGYDETVRVIQAIKAPALGQQDAWDWGPEDGDGELWAQT